MLPIIFSYLFALLCFAGYFQQQKRANRIRDIPSGKIRSLPIGPAEVSGTLHTPTPLIAPMSGQPCALYHITLSLTTKSSSGSSSKTPRTSTIREYRGQAPDVQISDDTGSINLAPYELDIHSSTQQTFHHAPERTLGDKLRGMINISVGPLSLDDDGVPASSRTLIDATKATIQSAIDSTPGITSFHETLNQQINDPNTPALARRLMKMSGALDTPSPTDALPLDHLRSEYEQTSGVTLYRAGSVAVTESYFPCDTTVYALGSIATHTTAAGETVRTLGRNHDLPNEFAIISDKSEKKITKNLITTSYIALAISIIMAIFGTYLLRSTVLALPA